MDSRPTRMIRARDLAKGVTILRECHSPTSCCVPADRHTEPGGALVKHELTVLDAETHGGHTSGIVVTESGEQDEIGMTDWCVVRVFADVTAPLRG